MLSCLFYCPSHYQNLVLCADLCKDDVPNFGIFGSHHPAPGCAEVKTGGLHTEAIVVTSHSLQCHGPKRREPRPFIFPAMVIFVLICFSVDIFVYLKTLKTCVLIEKSCFFFWMLLCQETIFETQKVTHTVLQSPYSNPPLRHKWLGEFTQVYPKFGVTVTPKMYFELLWEN